MEAVESIEILRRSPFSVHRSTAEGRRAILVAPSIVLELELDLVLDF
jgi:hypothetical protein